MLYELINPSDSYVFNAKSREVAALVVFSFGTSYGAKPQEGDEDIPVFLLDGVSGANEWYEEQFGRTTDEGLSELMVEVADALDSFMYGHFEDWNRYIAACEAITDPEKLRTFKEKWHDGHTSLNDIGGAAHLIAESLRERKRKGVA